MGDNVLSQKIEIVRQNSRAQGTSLQVLGQGQPRDPHPQSHILPLLLLLVVNQASIIRP